MEEKNKTIIAVILILLALFILDGNKKLSPTESMLAEENPDIIFTGNLISLAESLKGKDDFETTKNVLGYIVNNIQYDPEVSIPYCFTETADKVYTTKSGDCVSMTRLSTALLRLNNISVRTVGGCINFRYSCAPAFSVVGLGFDDIPVSDIEDGKKRGYLHEWSEAYINGRWYILENTAGLVLPSDCAAYKVYSESTNQINRCIISNQKFIQECRSWN
jgi:transglutaminase-like putative cysteine protease